MEASLKEAQAEFARAVAELRPAPVEIADWQALDMVLVYELLAMRMGHVYQHRVAKAVTCFGWLNWMAVLREQVLRKIWRGVLPYWSLWTGLAPPVGGTGGTLIELRC
jgi:hypothetical protein